MILNRQRAVPLPKRKLEAFLRRVGKELAIGETQVTICLVSDTEIARMNEAFREKKGATDVLSFPAVQRRKPVSLRRGTAAGKGKSGHSLGDNLGDIAIAPATARRNAKVYGRSFSSELQILILHGVLHLLGYDHETDGGEMERVERRLRKRLGLS
jgi:probable rRNA maturation factor